MKKQFKYFIILDKFYYLIAKRYSKGIFHLINITLGIFSGILFYYSLKYFSVNNGKIGLPLVLGSLGLIFFAELININFKNSFTSIFTLRIIDIYPLSKMQQIKNLYFSNLIHSRLIYYLPLFVLIFFFSVNINTYFILKSVMIFILIYLISTAVFTFIDYGYACLIKNFGEKAKYSFMIFFIIILAATSILAKLNINIDDYSSIPIQIIKFLLNK
jgi:hypothetical protein